MAYTDTRPTSKNLAGLSGVALIHVALAFGLAAGLTVKYTAPPPVDPVSATNVKIDLPPPPPAPDDVVEPDEVITHSAADQILPPVTPPVEMIFAPPSPVELTLEFPPLTPPVEVATRASGGGVSADPLPPAHIPTDPVPSNGPTGWVTTNDYPTRALMRGWEGELTYLLSIDANGRVEDCSIVNTSGRNILDREACRVIERRARFEAATDNGGLAVAGTYRGRVNWVIPED